MSMYRVGLWRIACEAWGCGETADSRLRDRNETAARLVFERLGWRFVEPTPLVLGGTLCPRHAPVADGKNVDELPACDLAPPTVARHHEHADHVSGGRRHDHDGLGQHLHHRRPDYVPYPGRTRAGYDLSETFTGTPDQVLDS